MRRFKSCPRHMKRCPRCNRTLEELEFYKNKSKRDGLDTMCKSCRRIRNEQHILEYPNTRINLDAKRFKVFRDFLDALKSEPCMDCNVAYPAYVMQFDHRDGVEKLFNVSEMRGQCKDIIMTEISKCDLVCANCHAIRGHNRRTMR